MANSAVSILSVNLNEEMLRANSKGDKSSGDGGQQSSKENAEDGGLGRHARKHSLGSNVENEFSFKSVQDDEDKENSRTESVARPEAGAEARSELADADVDMDATLVQQPEDELLVECKEKASLEEEKATVETEVGAKKPKKKGLGWLTFH
jgi:hypothetical protein